MSLVSSPLAGWTDELSIEQSLRVLTEFAEVHLDLAGDAFSGLRDAIKQRRWKDVCDFDFNLRSSGHKPELLLHAMQARGFFAKFEQLPLGVDKEAVAYEKFQESEIICKAQNEFWGGVRKGSITLTPRLGQEISLARRSIRRILGRAPKISELKLAFGPGATTATKKKNACPSNKFGAGLQCSCDLLSSGLVPEVLRCLPHWADAFGQGFYSQVEDPTTGDLWWADVVSLQLDSGHLQFVPKNAKTYRAIVTEPVLNTMVQHGVARYMERRMGRCGIKVDDQRINADLAWLGSVYWASPNGVSTVDLSMASDLISKELVRVLMPEDWYRLLSAVRTSTVQHRGSEFGLEKFSSMGNGITFPLETLIFWALTHAACITDNCDAADSDDGPTLPRCISGRLGVFGDDIAFPQENSLAVIRTLEQCGFVVNVDKSFCAGPFRESCGKDFYNGFNVRPYFQKDLVSARTLCILHNYYVRNYGFGNLLSKRVLKHIPRHLRLYGPDGYGDGHLVAQTFPNQLKPKQLAKGYRGTSFETFSQEPETISTRFPGDWVSPLYTVYTRADSFSPQKSAHPSFFDLVDSTPVRIGKDGRPQWPVPSSGKGGNYVRVKIYTLQ